MPNENIKSEYFLESMVGASLLIIESAAFTYSVLRSWGYKLHYPLAAMVDNLEMTDEIVNKLGIFQTRVISTNMSPKEFQKALESYHDDLCVLSFMSGRYTSENMETVLSLVASGGAERLEINMPLLLVFQKIIPEEYQDKFSIAIQIGQTDLNSLKREEIDAYLNKLKHYILNKTQVIEHEISKQPECDHENKDSRFWNAVIKMIRFIIEEEGDDEERLKEHLYPALKKAYDLSASYEFNCQIPSLFREMFDKSIPVISGFLPEADVVDYSAQNMMGKVLYDSDYYYIPENLFTKICEPLTAVCCTVNQIKDALASEGILFTQGKERIYKTVKKMVGRSNTPVRFIRLNRDALEGSTMEMTFVNIYEIRRKRDE